ncbi:MAG: hypothetical protein CLLPBCKN_001844 [Chroococcidiopsis cubana SAG 39.79]|uniref:Uncharacterized protein n=1 Tax=Chroococcidiopsis cubana SAG 39.79 TaxID=388085 RepID=A0AB37UQY0_9CYAN|nr:hypothetical protein [Chroococcidiopsis cubana]MDZ4872456.1 hypothetical protein [Chroococcidiopsis cubana SAG 39.79]PSB61455.1 hypothetical protein C7B79_21930 [Chroococcidiopsis cubana CCALA 043]RUT13679.1 hypothetical protein DSM107010_09540 [Chroococcidiopsis cubana SAG 39.79]
MQLNSHKQHKTADRTHSDWLNKIYDNSLEQCQRNGWVKLRELPSTYSHDEALLLCQVGKDEWLAWIPDRGEAVLHADQFEVDGNW